MFIWVISLFSVFRDESCLFDDSTSTCLKNKWLKQNLSVEVRKVLLFSRQNLNLLGAVDFLDDSDQVIWFPTT